MLVQGVESHYYKSEVSLPVTKHNDPSQRLNLDHQIQSQIHKLQGHQDSHDTCCMYALLLIYYLIDTSYNNNKSVEITYTIQKHVHHKFWISQLISSFLQ